MEGAKLKTSDGRAEVEFEDGSTLRIVPDSVVEFPQLSLRDSGAKVSAVEVTKGTAYVNFAGTKDDELSVRFSEEKITVAHAGHLRIAVGEKDSSIAVFKGLAQVESPSGAIEVKKNQTVTFDLDSNEYKLAKNIHETPYDSWDDQQNEYHTRYAAKSYNNYSPYAYGTTDLAYYGNFSSVPGYGMMWQPYFAGTGWDPFMDGAWAFNSGIGFGWVSAYPWGWTPYHYGSWAFIPGYGWGWQPGGSWNTWYAQPRVLNAPKGFTVPCSRNWNQHSGCKSWNGVDVQLEPGWWCGTTRRDWEFPVANLKIRRSCRRKCRSAEWSPNAWVPQPAVMASSGARVGRLVTSFGTHATHEWHVSAKRAFLVLWRVAAQVDGR